MAFIRRASIKRKPNKGYIVAVIVGGDTETNVVNSVDVDIATIEGQPTPSPNFMKLPLRTITEKGDKRFVSDKLNFEGGDPVNLTYTIKATMKDKSDVAIGTPVELKVDVISDRDSRVKNASIRQINEEQFRLRVVVDDRKDEIGHIEVEFAPIEGDVARPTPTQMELQNPQIKGDNKIFIYKPLTFDVPTAAVDEFYVLVIDLIDKKGTFLASTEAITIVEGLETDSFL